MIKIFFKFLLVIICLFNINLYSQNQGTQPGDPNDLDQAFVPDKNSVLNSVGTYASSSANNQTAALKNMIMFSPTLLGRSIASFTYERVLGNTVALEGGLGLCFARDYMQYVFASVASDAFADNNVNQKYISLSNIMTNSTSTGGPSLFLTAGIKFYFSEIAPEGSYFQVNMRYYSNTLQYTPEDDNNIQFVGNSTVSVKNLNFNLIYGYQIESGKNSNFIQNLYFGFGIRKLSYNGISMETGTNASGNTQTYYVADGSTQTSIAPTFIMGYSLGFGF
jgi:hypothetical protein